MEFINLLKLKWLILKNNMVSVKNESALKISVIFLFIVFYGFGSFWLLLRSFDYVSGIFGFGYFLIDRLLYVFFMILFFMLIVSQLIIAYSGFYKNNEVGFLLSSPLHYRTVYKIKFLESTFLSSWAFAFLAVPLFFAYGVGKSLGIGFYVITVCLSIQFIFITAAIGTVLAVLLTKIFSSKFYRTIIKIGVILLVAAFVYYKKAKQDFNWNTGDLGLVLDQLLSHTKISLYPLLPSYWIAKSILSFVARDWSNFVFYFMLNLSSAFFCVWVCFLFGDRFYFNGWESIAAGAKTKLYKPRISLSIIDKNKYLVIILKDLKLFFRDPVQWSQFAIFFGMIGLYILNLRSMRYDIDSIFWKNLISYLNIGTIALTLGTLCTRFIYPQMSIESKRLWIIGLMPVKIRHVLFLKYITNVFICLLITLVLMIISNIMLKVSLYMYVFSIISLVFMSFGLPGLALGLGAIFPNIKEDDTSKIVSGFGGTLTLIVSIVYIIIILVLVIMPIHLYFTKHILSANAFIYIGLINIIISLLVSIAVSAGPVFFGYKNIEKIEV